jgi:hypothetical protein
VVGKEEAMIVIVTGGRTYAGTGLVEELDKLEREEPGFYLIVGGHKDRPSTGADLIAQKWAADRHALNAQHRWTKVDADWKRLRRAAGPIRNGEMVNHALWAREWLDEPIICLAAPGGRGTADCVRRCREAGFEVRAVSR